MYQNVPLKTANDVITHKGANHQRMPSTVQFHRPGTVPAQGKSIHFQEPAAATVNPRDKASSQHFYSSYSVRDITWESDLTF